MFISFSFHTVLPGVASLLVPMAEWPCQRSGWLGTVSKVDSSMEEEEGEGERGVERAFFLAGGCGCLRLLGDLALCFYRTVSQSGEA